MDICGIITSFESPLAFESKGCRLVSRCLECLRRALVKRNLVITVRGSV